MGWKEGRENGKSNLGEKEMSVASPQGKGNKKEWYLLCSKWPIRRAG